MQKDLKHGLRLTDDEYERKIIELHRALPPMSTTEQDKEVRRAELNLAIDHHLGRDFPPKRREALWAIQQRVEKRRLRLAFKYFLRRFLAKRVAQEAQGLAGYMVDEYAKVLNEDELESFFGLQKGERPVLPVDIDQLKK